ncbi:TerD family protein [Yoonia sp. 2307UL14-13]|uniref:TerD family protein n=1 Tax=Yoonia sp. 2307UL14-13 TaxID=3126506 RepID=UPI00309B7602
MASLTKGGNAPLGSTSLQVTVAWKDRNPNAEELDVSCFLLTDAKKVRSDADMIFYGQRQANDGSVQIKDLATVDADGRKTVFDMDLSKLAGDVTSLAIVGTTASGPVSSLERLKVVAAPDSGEAVEFDIATGDASEAALILGELYLRNGQWKFRAVAQGFNGGLGPLATNYGVVIDEPAAPSPPPPPGPGVPPPPPPTNNPTPEPPAPPSVNLSKVTLTKDKPSVSLAKKSEGFGQIEINLNWTQTGGQKKGIFGLKGKAIDLDLGCFFEMSNGQVGAVQALGNTFGSYEQPPFIELAGDDRTGAVSGGEWMRINGSQWHNLRRVLVYAFIYEGVPNWASADGTITIYIPDSGPVEVKLDEASNLGMCAIAEITNDNGGIKFSRQVQYFPAHPQMSEHYRYPLQWRAGRK